MRTIRVNLILIGVLVGSGLGLIAGWVIYPREHSKASPATLRADYQEIYMIMVAAAYRYDSDIDRAAARLDELGFDNPVDAITNLAQRAVVQKRNDITVATISELALALGGEIPDPDRAQKESLSKTLVPPASQTAQPEASQTPIPATTPFPTASPTTTWVYDYIVRAHENVCDTDLTSPLIQVYVADSNGEPLPGVRVLITWANGQDTFSTGLKPEIGLGYGDFTMKQGEVYSVQVGGRTLPLQGIISETCSSEGRAHPGSVLVRWQREG